MKVRVTPARGNPLTLALSREGERELVLAENSKTTENFVGSGLTVGHPVYPVGAAYSVHV